MGFWNRKKEIPAADLNVAKKLDDEMKQKAWEAKLAIAGAENANKTAITDLSTKGVSAYGVSVSEVKQEEDVKPKEKEWIWVEGYKAVNPDMSAKWGEMTYEVGKLYEMEGDVALCKYGYHFCLKPEFIHGYYQFGRLFKVRAEVEKDEYEKLKENGFYTYRDKSSYSIYGVSFHDRTVDKMVARKIELVEEITDYEIIKKVWDNNPLFVRNETDWWEFINFCKKAKCNSREDAWAQHMFIKKMMENGFSETIALVLFKRLQRGWINVERIVEFAEGLTQMEISNDMKIFLITDEVTKWHRDW
jgi:hypothetical protein